MSSLNKKLLLGLFLIIGAHSHAMLIPITYKKCLTSIKLRGAGQKRMNITHIPAEKRSEMKSIKDIKDHFDAEMKKTLRSLFDTEERFNIFIENQEKQKEDIKKCYESSKKNGTSEPLYDPEVLPFLVNKIQAVSNQFEVFPGTVISSCHLFEDSATSYEFQKLLYDVLQEITPVTCDAMFHYCIEEFIRGSLMMCFGGIILLSKEDSPTFVPPVLIVSHDMSESLKDQNEIPLFVNCLVYQYVGQLFCGHRNMLYHLNSTILSDEKMEQFERLKGLQKTIEEITCSLDNPCIAQENNLFYRKEGIKSALPKEKFSVMQKFLLSELIVDCHRNDGNIKE